MLALGIRLASSGILFQVEGPNGKLEDKHAMSPESGEELLKLIHFYLQVPPLQASPRQKIRHTVFSASLSPPLRLPSFLVRLPLPCVYTPLQQVGGGWSIA